ncbi:unnamed protein product [Boreogadus saida]
MDALFVRRCPFLPHPPPSPLASNRSSSLWIMGKELHFLGPNLPIEAIATRSLYEMLIQGLSIKHFPHKA